jgi:hypothetical protein
MPTILRNLRIDRVASVDKGAGEDVDVLLMKREFSDAERSVLAASGAALPDGSFPIETEEDLRNAMQAAARAKDPAKAKAHIRARAAALGLTGELSDAYKRDVHTEAVTALRQSLAAIIGDDVAKRDAADASISEFAGYLAGRAPMSQAHQDYMDEADLSDDEKDAFTSMSPAERDAYRAANPLEKRLPETVRKALAEAESLKKRLGALEDEKERSAFAKRAAAIGLAEADGETLRQAFRGDAGAQAKLETLIKGLHAQGRTGTVFAEFGRSGGSGGMDAAAELDLKAEGYRKAQIAAGRPCSQPQAFAKVYTDPANAGLKKRYDAEQAQKR